MLDYNLPRGNGSDILAVAGRNPKLAAVPKVIVTSFLQADELAQALELGASCLITKPVDFESFMRDVGAKIAELLQTGGDVQTRYPRRSAWTEGYKWLSREEKLII